LHPTSLPGEFGIGDLGDASTQFVDFLQKSGQRLWQVLPLGPTGYGDSPYQCYSAFAGNPLLIGPQRLVEDSLLSKNDIASHPSFNQDRVQYGAVFEFKSALLKTAFLNFQKTDDEEMKKIFGEFCSATAFWLDDYALFRALKDHHEGRAWNTWEPGLVRRDPAALESARKELHDEVEAQKFYQLLFFKQWRDVKEACRERNVSVIGDMPIFVAHDSADVWSNQHLFKLNKNGEPRVVAGVPPDYFSKTGQLWGNPIYDWDRMRADGFGWWIQRMRAMFQMFDIVRLDHFRGFAAAWEVPGKDQTAEHGQWVNSPGHELFRAVSNALGELPVIAEDLGVITPDVEALRDEFGFPGMRVLQFAFGGDANNTHLPHRFINNAVVYTGTHDNDTTKGWFDSLFAGDEDHLRRTREYCLKYLGVDGREIGWDMIRAASASVADTVIVPLQDVLGLGSEGRMNLPATSDGNWNWRFRAEALTEKHSSRLRELSEIYGRQAS
jgi:4-alpha-glucanotransferase